MIPRIPQSVGTIVSGAALATAVAIAGPKLFASHSTPVPVSAAPVSERVEVTDAAPADGIDMNHWHETGHPKLAPMPASPKKPGKIVKGK